MDPSASTRERFEQHMEEPACAACHVYIDPVGFGFEHFDPIGAWRENDAGHEIDASGELRGLEDLVGGDSHPFSSLPDLAMVLAGSQAAPACFATHYFRYAHGRLEAPEDECALEDLAQRFAAADHGNTHEHHNMPLVLAGRASGAISPGRLLSYGGDRHAGLLCAIAHAMGQDIGGFGDTGSGPLGGVLG